MRFTQQQYLTAIQNLTDAMKQLEPDGNYCSVCSDSGHMAFECGHNPLVAVEICREVSLSAEKFHDLLHYLAGYDQAFGVQLGPRKVVMPEGE